MRSELYQTSYFIGKRRATSIISLRLTTMGEFIPFVVYCGDLAQTETKEFIVSAPLWEGGLPTGRYTLLESYCADKRCDCRKVMVNILSKENNTILATIGYGWENEQFYIEWMHGDEEIGKGLAGAYLEPGGLQSAYSQACLQLFKEIIATEPSYVDLLKRHAKIFKDRLR